MITLSDVLFRLVNLANLLTIIRISSDIYIIDAIIFLDIIETNINVISDEEFKYDFNIVIDLDHSHQTR